MLGGIQLGCRGVGVVFSLAVEVLGGYSAWLLRCVWGVGDSAWLLRCWGGGVFSLAVEVLGGGCIQLGC